MCLKRGLYSHKYQHISTNCHFIRQKRSKWRSITGYVPRFSHSYQTKIADPNLQRLGASAFDRCLHSGLLKLRWVQGWRGYPSSCLVSWLVTCYYGFQPVLVATSSFAFPHHSSAARSAAVLLPRIPMAFCRATSVPLSWWIPMRVGLDANRKELRYHKMPFYGWLAIAESQEFSILKLQ